MTHSTKPYLKGMAMLIELEPGNELADVFVCPACVILPIEIHVELKEKV